jgi:DNA (cytosine-5)-methyltransferase 1
LKAKTLARIKRGLERFGDQYLVLELAYGHAANNRARPLSGELFTQSTRQSQGLVLPRPFLTVNYSPGYSKDIEDTLASITATDHHALVVPPAFLTSVNDFDDRNISVERPMGTQTTQEKWGVTIPPFMITLRRHHGAKGIDEPLDTIVAGGNHHGLIMPAHFLMSYYGRGASHRGLEEVMGTLTGNDKHALVQSPFLLGYANGSGPAKSAVDELRTIHTENGQSVVQPDGFNVDDCSFRMLQPHEVGRGMAFSDDYVVLGTKREQVRQYGNAVTPPVMQMLIERCVETLR